MRVQKFQITCLLSLILTAGANFSGMGQINDGIYQAISSEGAQEIVKSVTVGENYLIHNTYRSNPAEFVSSWGGFYKDHGDSLKVDLEFNSDFDKDQEIRKEFTIIREEDKLTLNNTIYSRLDSVDQELDGFWLFATRGPDMGQKSRGDQQPRKTLKVLLDGQFQWIAYHTETFDFLGTGGGRYQSQDGRYIEYIDFFSRDNSRVGAELEFDYRLEGNDWHHTGKNSRGEPLYEIWSRR